MYEKRKDYLIDERLTRTGSLDRNPWKPVRFSQTQKLEAWLRIPGNRNKTAADYARSLKDRTVVQGEF